MAQLWKYITELSATDRANEESDQIVINQGGHSVQIPWSILKAGIENRINTIDGLLDKSVFTGDDEEEGYIGAEISIDDLKQDIVLINESLTNINATIKDLRTLVNSLYESQKGLINKVETQGNDIESLSEQLKGLPKINQGDVDPNTILSTLNPKENDIYILTSDITE